MSLGTFCLVLATLLIGGHAQHSANSAQVPKSYSLTPLLDPFGLTRPRPALFSLTSVPIGRLPLFGFGTMQGLYPMGQVVKPNGQNLESNAATQTTQRANAGVSVSGTTTEVSTTVTTAPETN